MGRPPRDPREPLVNGFMLWRIGFVTVLLVVTSFGLFLWELDRGMELEFGRTAALNMLVMGQIFYLFNCRRLTASVLSKEGILGNPLALKAVALLLLLQLSMTYLPFSQALFGTVHLDAGSWLRILAAGGLLFLAVEIEKTFWHRRPQPGKIGTGGTANRGGSQP